MRRDGDGRVWVARVLAAFLLLGVLGRPAAAQTATPDAWLDRAAAAPATVSYRGTKIVMLWSSTGAEASTVQVDHLAPSRYRLEYIPTPGRPRRLVVDDGTTRWQYEPTARLALRSPSPMPADDGLPADRLSLLRSNYTLTLTGEDRVAGRDALVMAVRPRSDPGPTLLLWIDKDTGLVLRSERRHANGSLAQAAVFTEIRYQAPPVAGFAFIPPRGVSVRQLSSSEPVRVEDIPARMGFHPIVPAALSGGFILNQVLASGSHTSRVAVLQYSDGLVTVSLFEHRAIEGARRTLRPAANVPVADRRLAARQIGDVAIFHWQVRGVDMTLTGELSPDRLERIASGLGVEDTPGRVARLKFWLGSFWRHVLSVILSSGH